MLLLGVLLGCRGHPEGAPPVPEPTHPPAVTCPGRTIWASAPVPSGGVVLFRRTFELPRPVAAPELRIIADTRYEAWLDGRWLGRGPARFSRVRQEFDRYALDSLEAGAHTLAVLVQYAPNRRRSEDLGGGVRAALLDGRDADAEVLVASDGAWRARVSPAWDAASAPVSDLGLIGPTELLDLRALPSAWMAPHDDAAAWPPARVLSPDPFSALAPRSIPPLAAVPHAPVRVVERGVVSPGCRLMELASPDGTATITFTAAVAQPVRLEALVGEGVTLDGAALAWRPLDDLRRVDVLVAERDVAAGAHVLGVAAGAEADARALAVCGPDLAWPASAPGVGRAHDPGPRTLLGHPVPSEGPAPSVRVTDGAVDVAVPAGDAPRYVVLDFGRTLHARMVTTATGPTGTLVDAGWAERLVQGRPLPAPGSRIPSGWRQVDAWTLDGTPRTLTTLDARAGRYLLLRVYGPGAVTLESLHAVEARYPVRPVGAFASSDPVLDRIWQVGVASLYPNMTDAYTDTPWRERGQWWGDAYVAHRVNRACFGDTLLFRRGLLFMADAFADGRPPALAPNAGDTTLLDYGLLWVLGLHEYHRLTGDAALVRQVFPQVQALFGYVAQYEHAATGLLDVPEGAWWETALIDWPAGQSRYGQSTALNAMYAAALDAGAVLAEVAEDAEGAARWHARASTVRAQIHAHLYVPAQGRYLASLRQGQPVTPTAHAQAWPLAYGVVPEAEVEAVVAALLELVPHEGSAGSSVDIYGMFWVLEALGRSGHIAEALDVIRWSYGPLLDAGATTWWESFRAAERPGASLSHAWGGAPTWFLTTYVLGARKVAPGAWELRPALGGVERAQGRIPLDAGALDVRWRCTTCAACSLTLDAPPSTAGAVVVPLVAGLHLTSEGQTLWRAGRARRAGVTARDGEVHVTLAGGHDEMRIRGDACFVRDGGWRPP